jgi:hypothetical protein
MAENVFDLKPISSASTVACWEEPSGAADASEVARTSNSNSTPSLVHQFVSLYDADCDTSLDAQYIKVPVRRDEPVAPATTPPLDVVRKRSRKSFLRLLILVGIAGVLLFLLFTSSYRREVRKIEIEAVDDDALSDDVGADETAEGEEEGTREEYVDPLFQHI